jgi:hypothetical protein
LFSLLDHHAPSLKEPALLIAAIKQVVYTGIGLLDQLGVVRIGMHARGAVEKPDL